uniref:PTS lactose/cellobiose transporter subunit IIA n=1 Tax=Candidatus Enterococcus willemsii TaxID=1857215 RepID=UPI00403F857F
MKEKINTELDSMAIILHAGNAKSCAFEAMMEVKQGNVESYNGKYQEARKEIVLAKKAHAELLRKLSAAECMENIDLLLVHAEGHLSSTDIAVELIGDIGELYKWKENLYG